MTASVRFSFHVRFTHTEIRSPAFGAATRTRSADSIDLGPFHTKRCRGGVHRRQLEIGVHHADAVVWGPVYRTRLNAAVAQPSHADAPPAPHVPPLAPVARVKRLTDDPRDRGPVHGDAVQRRHRHALAGGELVRAVERVDVDDDARRVDRRLEVRRPRAARRRAQGFLRVVGRRGRDAEGEAAGEEARAKRRLRRGGGVDDRRVVVAAAAAAASFTHRALVALLRDDAQRGAVHPERLQHVHLHPAVRLRLRVHDVLAPRVARPSLVAHAEVRSRPRHLSDNGLALEREVQEQRDELRDGDERPWRRRRVVLVLRLVHARVEAADVVREGRRRRRDETSSRSRRARRVLYRVDSRGAPRGREEPTMERRRRRRSNARGARVQPDGRARNGHHRSRARGTCSGGQTRTRISWSTRRRYKTFTHAVVSTFDRVPFQLTDELFGPQQSSFNLRPRQLGEARVTLTRGVRSTSRGRGAQTRPRERRVDRGGRVVSPGEGKASARVDPRASRRASRVATARPRFKAPLRIPSSSSRGSSSEI
eukprot:31284-Pelagococcus_subviridis.AAC.4